MKLVSTFRDYYDHAFDGRGATFERIGGNVGPTRREQFDILSKAGYMMPKMGYVPEVLGTWCETEKAWVNSVVAYKDETAHCGEGKELFRKTDLQSNPHMGALAGTAFTTKDSGETRCIALRL